MEQLKTCPFCNEGLEIVGNGHYYAHKTNGCILQHLCFECDDVEAIKVWNTRKPMDRIVERLETEILEQLSDCGDDWFTAEQINKAIDIVKEEGAE